MGTALTHMGRLSYFSKEHLIDNQRSVLLACRLYTLCLKATKSIKFLLYAELLQSNKKRHYSIPYTLLYTLVRSTSNLLPYILLMYVYFKSTTSSCKKPSTVNPTLHGILKLKSNTRSTKDQCYNITL